MVTRAEESEMARLPLARRLLKIFHPEGIPWPGTIFYSAASATRVFQRNYELVARHIIGYRAEGNLLDIGTGPGWLLVKLHERAPRLRLTGADVSPSMVARARKNMVKAGLADMIEIRQAEASHLPFDDRSFDMVVSTGSIHHWKNPTAGLNEVYRVLKAGGYSLLYDIVSDIPKPVLREMAREFGRLKMMMLWLHAFEEPFYSRENFASLASPTLFREGRIEFIGVLCCLILRKEAEAGSATGMG